MQTNDFRKLLYNSNDPFSIEAYAKKLLNKSLREVIGNSATQTRAGKGKFGQLIEDLYFHYKPNSEAKPDFPEAGVELKTSPIKMAGRGFIAKERLVFNMIDYSTEHLNTFRSSSFWKKNALLLLMFYLYEKEKLDVDYIFKIIRLWRFPIADLKIIKDDWTKIVSKIKAGKAHELSEGDTIYLGACTKGANKESLRNQPFSNVKAMGRAFSLKAKYLNYIIQKSLEEDEVLADDSEYESILIETTGALAAEPLHDYLKRTLYELEPIVKNLDEYKHGETFEQLVIRKYKPYYGKSEIELAKIFNIANKITAKNKFDILSRYILGVKHKKIEEFEKGDILMKTIRLEKNSSIKEHISFKQIQFKEIVEQEWHESTWFEELNRRFFFVIFQADFANNYRLKKVMFWSIPPKDMETLEQVWNDTRRKITQGDFEHFIKASENRIGHVRPKGRDSMDFMEAPNGTMQKKKCFWLNKDYIISIINNE
ncbi:MAG TPA: MutH/Sau3AI family endonuclease [Parafilimonas sp.]|nr:MutH/Sau3AI family endonuclease [Parafilimonas sp.]